jgi:SAM-dependent methyltransferase
VERRLREWLAEAPPRRLLDARCASGRFAGLATEDYVGLDTDPSAVQHARRRYRRDPRKRFLVGDAVTVSLPARWFDLAVLVGGRATDDEASAIATLRMLARASRSAIIVIEPSHVAIETLSARCDAAGLRTQRVELAGAWRLVSCAPKESAR